MVDIFHILYERKRVKKYPCTMLHFMTDRANIIKLFPKGKMVKMPSHPPTVLDEDLKTIGQYMYNIVDLEC